MREKHLPYLCCPACRNGLSVQVRSRSGDGRIETGELQCVGCRSLYPIVRFVPRFVPDEGYVAGFGLEWNVHRRTQYDASSGLDFSERRFFGETRWPRNLDGEILIEAGSGSGRFTEHALSTGATVLSLDYSRAVDANHESNGEHANVLIVQGDLYRMPFPREIADRLFCFGVLQHTPDPRSALASLVDHARPGGDIVADIYAKTFARYVLGTKYWIRPFTRRLPPDRLYAMTTRYVDTMWPLARRIQTIPKVGAKLNWRLLIADYSREIDDDATLLEWARLDTFDMLAPRYDKPARAKTVRRWCARLGLEDVDVTPGYNGVEIRARRPLTSSDDQVSLAGNSSTRS